MRWESARPDHENRQDGHAEFSPLLREYYDGQTQEKLCIAVRVGEGCLKLHSATMRNLQVNPIELDEIWAYVGKKQRKIVAGDSDMIGDQHTFIALADTAKAIITYRTGKRTSENTQRFADGLRARVIGSPEISTHGFNAYPWAIAHAFGENVAHGVVEKH